MTYTIDQSSYNRSIEPHSSAEPIPISEQEAHTSNIPVVSICCTTFNHERFIAETIEGFLQQKTTFPVEIIIHNDASTDKTTEIIKELSNKYPKIIIHICQQENQYSQGKRMFPFIFPHAKAPYIAMCEGDDKWTDTNKLQRQVDFLASHPDYILTADNSIWHDTFKNTKTPFSDLPERDISLLELLGKRSFATASVLFRNEPGNIYDGKVGGDVLMWCHMAKRGKIRYFPLISSIYLRHSGGVTEGDKTQWAKRMIRWNTALEEQHPEINDSVFKHRNMINFKDAINQLYKAGNYYAALLTADELAKATNSPEYYDHELRVHFNQLLTSDHKQHEESKKQLNNLKESRSYKIGSTATMPIIKAQRLLIRIINESPFKNLNYKRALKKRGVIFIDKQAIRKSYKKLIPLRKADDTEKPKIIVSLTSFPERIPDIFYTIYSLLNQHLQPDMLILWLGEDQFPNKERDLPSGLLQLQGYGLTIRWRKDIKSFTKLIYALKEHPDDVIITADDDIYYPEEWLSLLHASYLNSPQDIHCHRAHRLTFDNTGHLLSYNDWQKCVKQSKASNLNFFTGVGGVLYPPKTLHNDIQNEYLFSSLCPTADDIWFWAMATLNHTKIQVVENNINQLTHVNPEVEYQITDGFTLNKINHLGNDLQLNAIFEHYKDNDILNIARNS